MVTVLRLVKHIYLGNIQFVNLPAAITFIAAILIGWKSGILVGFFGYFISDFFIALPGPWTLVNGVLLALFSLIIAAVYPKGEIDSKPKLIVVTYLVLFMFDVFSSWFILYVTVGGTLIDTFVFGLLGLFFPLGGGFIPGIGPITEFVTGFLITILLPPIKQIFNEVKINEN